jgi:tRNA modification GTPase
MVDTAGLRETEDVVEKEGVLRTWKVIRGSDVVVFVHDSTQAITREELQLLEKIKKHKEIIIANNKIDLQANNLPDDFVSKYTLLIETSATNNVGIEQLKDSLFNVVIGSTRSETRESVIITNERHYSALLKAKHSMTSAIDSLKNGKSEEFIAVDLRSAIESIGEIIGLVTTEEILNSIFSKFCIGK